MTNHYGEQRQKLRIAILSAYPSIPKLKMMVDDQLGHNLDAIAGGSNLEEVVFNLIVTAESQGWLEQLIRHARNSNPGSKELKVIAEELFSNSSKNPDSTIQTQSFDFKRATLNLNPRIVGIIGRSYEIIPSLGRAKSFKEDLGNGVLLEMVKIPGGTFFMGSPENEPQRWDNEGPRHKVTIQPLFMGKFPVTQEQYEAIMGENPSRFKGKNKPVECVSWDNAVEFCAQISQSTRRTYRLPSEAEWEYACRARTSTPFCFGETITTDLANYNGNYTYGSGSNGQYREQTTNVGSFPANAFGLYDMHGNVWEWCQDSWFDTYHGAANDGSAIILNNVVFKVLRGGSWFSCPRYCRCGFRYGCVHDLRDIYVGFRVVVAV